MTTTPTPDHDSDADAALAAAESLRRMAGDLQVRALVRGSPILMRILGAPSRRFVAGPDLPSALDRSLELRRAGILVSIDFMGEDIRDPLEAEHATREFVELVRTASALQIGASISVNLSHIGLAIDRTVARGNCERIAEAAMATGAEVILNMEGSDYRQDILDLHAELGPRFPNLGITLQACLERTPDDVARCLRFPGRIRLVKGAYDEFKAGSEIRGMSVNQRYAELTDRLLGSGHSCSIATHDPVLLHRAARRVREGMPGRTEFEMLFGVAQRRLEELRDQGHPVRVYLPYGSEWLLYVCHRVAEHPPNLQLAVRELIDELQAWVRLVQPAGDSGGVRK